MKKIIYDKEFDTVLIKWGKLGKSHIGWCETLELGGVTIVIDRNKKGIVKALEIL